MMSKSILLTGIPSSKLFYAEKYDDFSITYSSRKKDIRTFEDILDDCRVCGNTGNLLIGEGAAAALEGTNYVYLPFWYLMSVMKSPTRAAALRKAFDLVVLATANMIRPSYSAHAEADVLEALNMPTVIMGMGIQDRSVLDRTPEGTLRLLRYLQGSDHYVLARGKDTASYLLSKGVKNAIPTGCPSLFMRPDEMKAAISSTTRWADSSFGAVMLGGYLGSSVQSNHDGQFLSEISGKLCYIMQDEFLHYGLVIEDNKDNIRIYDGISGAVERKYYHKNLSDTAFRPSIHIFTNTADWRRWASSFDIYFGRRFHGAIMAMQAGVPAVFVAVDDRMRELLDNIEFPYMDASAFDAEPNKASALRRFLRDYDAGLTVEKYVSHLENFRAVLAEIVS